MTAKSIPLLNKIKDEGRVWADLCEEYGVDNPDPPWRLTLESTCEVLNEGACTLPSLERRDEEDYLVEELYKHVPHPERQLLALAHSMILRGVISEEDLEKQMNIVEKRLNVEC
tara:strand:- start:135 stop:476 length:342 start_codon:yes stop_codon:yes gene_type:complete